MTRPLSKTDYAVLVTPLDQGFELKIRELQVSVRARDLAEGWRLLQERKQEVIDYVSAAGLIDELPTPLPP